LSYNVSQQKHIPGGFMKKIQLILTITILLTGIFPTLNCKIIDSVVKKQREKEEINRINTTNTKINQDLQEGIKAYNEKNYNLAIEKFNEGYNADPTYAGSAPVFLNNKSLALIGRGTAIYNNSVKSDEATRKAAKESAKNDFEETVSSSEKALEILRNVEATDENFQKNYELNTILAFTNRKNAYRLTAQTGSDRTKGKEALIVFQEYMLVETDPAKKAKAQMELALTLQDSDEFELAVTEFKKILANDPNNVDALAGAGLNLVNVGYTNEASAEGKAQLKEAITYLQQYVDIAPETHKFKQEAKGIIESLKESEAKPSIAKKPFILRGKGNLYSESDQINSNLNSSNQNSTALIKNEKK
jgi:tetratricopeptide (TPR) repeat protein